MSLARRALLPTIGLFTLLFTHSDTAARHRVVFNRIGPTRMALYLAKWHPRGIPSRVRTAWSRLSKSDG